jgi:AcrR family transcriptional regulator
VPDPSDRDRDSQVPPGIVFSMASAGADPSRKKRAAKAPRRTGQLNLVHRSTSPRQVAGTGVASLHANTDGTPATMMDDLSPHQAEVATRVDVRRQGRRINIQRAALTLFAIKGYQSTTMAEIGEVIGIRGPSLYKHVPSKEDLLFQIILGTMDAILRDQRAAVDSSADVEVQFRRAVEAHVAFHARHRDEAFVSTRELDHLREANRAVIVGRRAAYERGLRNVIIRGVELGRFEASSPKLTAYAILDMGMGVPLWFNFKGAATPQELAYLYGELALRMVAART